MRRGDGHRIAESERVELADHLIARPALGLVHHEHHALGAPTQFGGDLLVVRRQALAAIDHEEHHVGLDHRLPGLARHLRVDPRFRIRLEAAGVDHIESGHFTVANAMARLDNLPADPWADFRKAAVPLDPADRRKNGKRR